MFKANGYSIYLEIVRPDWAIYEIFLYLKEIERVIFRRRVIYFRTAKNLWPNLQKLPLPSKIPGYVAAQSEKVDIMTTK